MDKAGKDKLVVRLKRLEHGRRGEVQVGKASKERAILTVIAAAATGGSVIHDGSSFRTAGETMSALLLEH